LSPNLLGRSGIAGRELVVRTAAIRPCLPRNDSQALAYLADRIATGLGSAGSASAGVTQEAASS
jgi:hypothetical protein